MNEFDGANIDAARRLTNEEYFRVLGKFAGRLLIFC